MRRVILSSTISLEMQEQYKWNKGRKAVLQSIGSSELGPDTYALRMDGINQHS